MAFDIESEIEALLRRRVEQVGGACLKFVSPGMDGVPDRLLLFPGGRMAFAETKRRGEKERKRQVFVHRILRRLGFTVYASVDRVEKINQIIADFTEGSP